MDEYPQQKASRNLFSKGPTKNDGGRKGFFKGFRRKSEVVGICSSTGGGGSEKKMERPTRCNANEFVHLLISN